ncbi:hypothetical protein L6452_17461 [Arctium lappa]|uniref:Uncharacterized protein n=1 Tax=Arctium lappa TaxID=4217 RepID=A0ACB9C3S3_ARCLA|nr:hypothetical protein L6452_17461 [Arctium lappa]
MILLSTLKLVYLQLLSKINMGGDPNIKRVKVERESASTSGDQPGSAKSARMAAGTSSISKREKSDYEKLPKEMHGIKLRKINPMTSTKSQVEDNGKSLDSHSTLSESLEYETKEAEDNPNLKGCTDAHSENGLSSMHTAQQKLDTLATAKSFVGTEILDGKATMMAVNDYGHASEAVMIGKLVGHLATVDDRGKKLLPQSLQLYELLPHAIQDQLMFGRDPLVNVQVGKIEAEKMVIQMRNN